MSLRIFALPVSLSLTHPVEIKVLYGQLVCSAIVWSRMNMHSSGQTMRKSMTIEVVWNVSTLKGKQTVETLYLVVKINCFNSLSLKYTHDFLLLL